MHYGNRHMSLVSYGVCDGDEGHLGTGNGGRNVLALPLVYDGRNNGYVHHNQI